MAAPPASAMATRIDRHRHKDDPQAECTTPRSIDRPEGDHRVVRSRSMLYRPRIPEDSEGLSVLGTNVITSRAKSESCLSLVR